MNATNLMAALLLGMLLFTGQAAADGESQDTQENDDCPVVDILLYYPYVAMYPQCISIPPGQG